MNPLITKIQESLQDYECTGRFCQHETSDKHYTIDINSIISLFQANIERLDKVRKPEVITTVGSSHPDWQLQANIMRIQNESFNQSIDQEISFMRETIKSLENVAQDKK